MDAERLAKAKEAGFGEKEATALANFANIMSARVVMKFLIEMVERAAADESLDKKTKDRDASQSRSECRDRQRLYKKLIAKLRRVKVPDYTGYQEITIDSTNGNQYRMRIQLEIVPPDHQLEFHLPPMPRQQSGIKQIFSDIDKFTQMALQYYSIAAQQSKLITDLADFFSELNMTQPRVNEHNRTIFFDEDYPERIGVIAYYVDDNGKMLSNDSVVEMLKSEIDGASQSTTE